MATGTLILIVTAGGTTWLGITGFLIGVVQAIVLTIATPGTLHALGVVAHELIRLALPSMATAVLIRSVRAVGYTIANVLPIDAHTIHTGCLILAASCRWAFMIDGVHYREEIKDIQYSYVSDAGNPWLEPAYHCSSPSGMR